MVVADISGTSGPMSVTTNLRYVTFQKSEDLIHILLMHSYMIFYTRKLKMQRTPSKFHHIYFTTRGWTPLSPRPIVPQPWISVLHFPSTYQHYTHSTRLSVLSTMNNSLLPDVLRMICAFCVALVLRSHA